MRSVSAFSVALAMAALGEALPQTTAPPSSADPVPLAHSPVQSGITDKCSNWYLVKPSDNCLAIVNNYPGLGLTQFLEWNPALGIGCGGLQSGYYVCVGTGGQAAPTLTPTTSRTTLSPTSSYSRTSTLTHSGGSSSVPSTAPSSVSSTAPSTITTTASRTTSRTASRTTSMTAPSSVSSTVPSTVTTTASSTAAMPPTQTGVRSDCTKFYTATSGDYCQKIVDAQKGTISLQQFLDWNPAVGPACSGILPGYRYCVAIPGTPTSGPTTGIPSPLQPGTISSCKDFYLVKSGDICLTIERQFNLNDEQFWAWNTGVKRDCTNLYAGNYICVRA